MIDTYIDYSLDITNREVSTDDNTPSDSGEDDVEDTSEKNSDGGDNEDAEKKGDAVSMFLRQEKLLELIDTEYEDPSTQVA